MNAKAKAWLVDTGERVGASFGEAVVAAVAAGALAKGVNADTIHVVLIAGLTAGAAVLKSALASIVNGTVSPASLAPAQQPGQAEQDAPPDPNSASGAAAVAPVELVPIVHDHLALLPAADGRKLGRKPKPHDPRDLKLARYLTSGLPTPPAHVDWATSVAAFPMLLNDRVGDCTIAGGLHFVQVWAAAAGNPAFTPSDAQALALYEQICGYNPADPNSDQGGVERDVLGFWRVNGMAGHKILAYVAVDPHNHTQVKTAIDLFGGVYVGLALPITAQAQGVHWTKKTGPNAAAGSWGGHCVIYTGYDRHGPKTVTWGQAGDASWGFHDAYCDEAWACVSPDWMNAAGVTPTGLNLAKLQADLAAL